MFIERSTRRIRFARTFFVLAGLLPCAAVVAWAVHLRSTAHREALRLQWQTALGIPLEVEAVEHPRPGVVRALGCRLGAADGSRLDVPRVEVETTPDEVRLRIERFVCDVAAARMLGEVAADWLDRGARYPSDCVVEIADFAWQSAPPAAPLGLRVECVARDADRAIRVVRPDPRQSGGDEVRIVRSAASTGMPVDRIEAQVAWAEKIPVAIATALVRMPAPPVGAQAAISGTVHAIRDVAGWSGTATASATDLDLAACTAGLQSRATGTATAVVRRLAWSESRVRDAEIECTAGRGRVEQRLLDGLVGTVGCRPGPAHRSLSGATERPFDAAGCLLRVDARGIELLSGPSLGGGLVVADGLSLIDPPGAVLPPTRLAWLLAPAGAVYVPSGGPGAWLLDVLPRSDSAARSGRPGEF